MTAPNPILDGLRRDVAARRPRTRQPAQGEPMSRVASAQAAVEHAAMRLAEISSSKLAVALADEGLGAHLSDLDVGHVVAIVRAIEAPHRHALEQRGQALAEPAQQALAPRLQANGARQTGPQQVTE